MNFFIFFILIFLKFRSKQIEKIWFEGLQKLMDGTTATENFFARVGS